ncbi:MAG: amidohydrolase family protein [SAR324 cluster bacterium]|nr:amidohydrolase family protein [SAR324 cluster bacterium]
MLAIVDTHQHLWDLAKLELPWLERVGGLKRSFLINDYLNAVKDQNVTKSVYMEVDVASFQKDLEVELITEICRDPANPMSGAVISGFPEAEDFKDRISQHKNNSFVKGLRRVLHVPECKRGLCLEDNFIEGVRHLGELGWVFDICIRPSELEDAVTLAKRCPQTTLILDHCGNADPKLLNSASETSLSDNPMWHDRDAWSQAILKIADQANTICKISGIVARVPKNWTSQDLAPTINFCLNAFGPDRVIFGGDWPVCTQLSSFDQWAGALRDIIRMRSEGEQKKLLSENAIRIYKL